MKKIKNLRNHRFLSIVLFYLFISVVMYQLYKRDFIWNGDDIYYHFQRILGLSDNFTNGLLASNISISNFGVIGNGVNIFYPWLTLIPFRIFFQFTRNWISAYYFGILFYFFVSFLISHYSMKKFSGSTKSAVIFSVIYNFSIYRLIDIFTRGAVAEYIATIFLPLCFLGFYEVFFGDEKQWQTLATGIILIIYTHVLTTFMSIIFFALLSILFIPKLKLNKDRIINFGKAAITTIGSTLIFTVPFMTEESFQKYGVPDKQKLVGLNFKQLIYESIINNSRRSVEGNIYNVGLTIILALIIGILVFRRFSFLYKSLYCIFVASFLFTTNLFPWHLLQDTPIEVIQFPYRFLMFATLFGAIILTQSIEILFKNQLNKSFPIILFILVIFNSVMWENSIINGSKGVLLASPKLEITQKMVNENRVPSTNLLQYIPDAMQSSFELALAHQIFINKKSSVQIPTIKNHSDEFYVGNIKRNDKIDLPFVKYKYTKAQINGQKVPITMSKRGFVELIVPKDTKSATINLSYGNHNLFMCAEILSILTWIYLFCSKYFIRWFKKLKSQTNSVSISF